MRYERLARRKTLTNSPVPVTDRLTGTGGNDDGTVVLTTGANSLKGKALQRDPRVCLCVDDETPPYSFVVIDGTAEITEDPGPLLEWATRIAGRYVGAERAEEYGRRNATPGELLVRITPNHVVAQADIAD
jgi:PPOX class probable F420-dependent enzyme